MIIGIEFEVPDDFIPDSDGCEEACILSYITKVNDDEPIYKCMYRKGDCPLSDNPEGDF